MIETYRDQEWLENLLADIWYEHFLDVPQQNDVRIIWGRRAKRRLGSISLDPKDRQTSIIRVNTLFMDLDVPEYVVRSTIFHEMTHYAHGFNSPLEQKQKHPHSGGVIRREFAERGQEEMYLAQQAWLKENWVGILLKHRMIRPQAGIRYFFS
ncbi:MAG: hypothetical protein WCI47_00765 [bacterium]